MSKRNVSSKDVIENTLQQLCELWNVQNIPLNENQMRNNPYFDSKPSFKRKITSSRMENQRPRRRSESEKKNIEKKPTKKTQTRKKRSQSLKSKHTETNYDMEEENSDDIAIKFNDFRKHKQFSKTILRKCFSKWLHRFQVILVRQAKTNLHRNVVPVVIDIPTENDHPQATQNISKTEIIESFNESDSGADLHIKRKHDEEEDAPYQGINNAIKQMDKDLDDIFSNDENNSASSSMEDYENKQTYFTFWWSARTARNIQRAQITEGASFGLEVKTKKEIFSSIQKKELFSDDSEDSLNKEQLITPESTQEAQKKLDAKKMIMNGKAPASPQKQKKQKEEAKQSKSKKEKKVSPEKEKADKKLKEKREKAVEKEKERQLALLKEEEEKRKKQLEKENEQRKKKEEEEKRKKQEAIQKQILKQQKEQEEEKQRRIEEEKKRKEEEERVRKEEEEKQKKLEEEKKREEEERIKKEEEERQRKLEEEKKKKEEEEKRKKLEEEKKQKQIEAEKKKQEEEKKKKEKEQEQKKLEEEKKKKEEELRKKQLEAERKKKEDDEKQKKLEEERKRKEAEELKKKEEEEKQRKQKEEEEKRMLEEEERKRKEQEELKKKEEEERKQKEEEALRKKKEEEEENERKRIEEEEKLKKQKEEEEKLKQQEDNKSDQENESIDFTSDDDVDVSIDNEDDFNQDEQQENKDEEHEDDVDIEIESDSFISDADDIVPPPTNAPQVSDEDDIQIDDTESGSDFVDSPQKDSLEDESSDSLNPLSPVKSPEPSPYKQEDQFTDDDSTLSSTTSTILEIPYIVKPTLEGPTRDWPAPITALPKIPPATSAQKAQPDSEVVTYLRKVITPELYAHLEECSRTGAFKPSIDQPPGLQLPWQLQMKKDFLDLILDVANEISDGYNLAGSTIDDFIYFVSSIFTLQAGAPSQIIDELVNDARTSMTDELLTFCISYADDCLSEDTKKLLM